MSSRILSDCGIEEERVTGEQDPIAALRGGD